MREHLGIDVDCLMEHSLATEEELRKIQIEEEEPKPLRKAKLDSESLMIEKQDERDMIERRHRIQDEFLSRSEELHSFNHDVDWEQGNNPNLKSNRKLTADTRVTSNQEHRKDVDGFGADNLRLAEHHGLGEARDSEIFNHRREVLLSPLASEGKGTVQQPKGTPRKNSQQNGSSGQEATATSPTISSQDGSANHVVEGLPTAQNPSLVIPADGGGASVPTKDRFDSIKFSPTIGQEDKHIFVDKDCMRDPVVDVFYLDTWQAVAEKNTKIFRNVFRCMPDSEVKSWKEYKEYNTYQEKFAEMQSHHTAKAFNPHHQRQTGPPGAGTTWATSLKPNILHRTGSHCTDRKSHTQTDEKSDRPNYNDRPQSEQANAQLTSPVDEKASLRPTDVPGTSSSRQDDGLSSGDDLERQRSETPQVDYSEALNRNATNRSSRRRRRRTTTLGSKRDFTIDEVLDKQRAEDLLDQVQGHLIMWPYDWYVPSISNKYRMAVY
jgi:phospholipase D1/2